MKQTQLPISLCHANCPRCRMPTEFRMFESGPGGDFATYQGAATGSIYRLDLAKAHFQGLALSSFLSPLEEKEGRLFRVPEEIRCKICGNMFSASSVMVDAEEVVEAFDL